MCPTTSTRAVGMVAPYDFALDRELWRWLPGSVDLLLTRTPDEGLPVSVEQAERLGDPAVIAAATRSVLTPSPAVVAYACTAGSFASGRAGERAIREAMLDAGAPRAVTTSGAVVAALRALGVRRVAVATPYDAAVTGLLVDYLTDCGLEVTASAHLGLDDEIWRVPEGATADLARRVLTPDAEAVFLSCTNLPTYDAIAGIEAELGLPVVTSNQATLWAALDLLGLAAVGPGQRLLGRAAS